MPVDNYFPKRAIRFKRGLSLMEAMVVLCLFSILIILGGGAFQPLWKKYDLRLAAKEVKGRLEFIRMKAILEGADYEVKIYGQTFLRHRANSEEDWTIYKLKDNIIYSTKTSHVCKFHDNGLAVGGTITLEIKGENYCEKVIVNSGGRISLKKPEDKC